MGPQAQPPGWECISESVSSSLPQQAQPTHLPTQGAGACQGGVPSVWRGKVEGGHRRTGPQGVWESHGQKLGMGGWEAGPSPVTITTVTESCSAISYLAGAPPCPIHSWCWPLLPSRLPLFSGPRKLQQENLVSSAWGPPCPAVRGPACLPEPP